MRRIDPKQAQTIIELYEQGFSRAEIATRTRMSISGVGRQLTRLFREGKVRKKTEQEEIVENAEGTVRCNIAISNRCIWGYETKERCKSLGLCDYILRTGHMRGCSAENCTKFEEITKDNPRRKDVM